MLDGPRLARKLEGPKYRRPYKSRLHLSTEKPREADKTPVSTTVAPVVPVNECSCRAMKTVPRSEKVSHAVPGGYLSKSRKRHMVQN